MFFQIPKSTPHSSFRTIHRKYMFNLLQDSINKMAYDINDKLNVTMRLMHCAKFFNYKVIGNATLNEASLFHPDGGLCRFLDMLPLYQELLNKRPITQANDYKAEWIRYRRFALLEVSKGDNDSCGLWTFWKNHKLNLPHMYILAKEIALIVPSSATVERLFSIFNSVYSEKDKIVL